MPTVIEYCVRNVDDERRRRLRERAETVRVRPCLEHCGTCRNEPFRIVDGDLVTGACKWGLRDGEGDAE